MRRPDLDRAAADEAVRLVAAHARRVRRRARVWRDAPDDRDALHALRTALRCLRALLRAFRPVLGGVASRGIRRRLRLASRATSALRDLDVFADWVAAQTGVPHHRRLRRRIREATAAAVADAVPAFLAAWGDADHRLRRALRAPSRIGRVATAADRRARFAVALRRAVQRERVTLRAGLATFDPVHRPAAVHALRIAAKRLRHVLDAAAPRTADVRHTVTWCRMLQDRAGAWRDAHVATAFLRRWRDEPAATALRRPHRHRLRERRLALVAFAADRRAWRAALDVSWTRA